MTDPYKVLGVAPNATDEEVKKTYHALARKYHPDKYRNSDLADLASEKMKEVNAAYEQIQNMRKNGGGYENQSNSGYSNSTEPRFSEIRKFISIGDVHSAERELNAVHEGDRGAEWNYLYGCLLIKKGQFVDAQRYINIACSMDPYNREYRAARENLQRQSQSYGGGYNTTGGNVGCSPCGICQGLLCADCCCECCGGDLIACC